LRTLAHSQRERQERTQAGYRAWRSLGRDNLRAAGFKSVEIVPTNLHPLVYAESLEAPANHHPFLRPYDVQPAEPLDLWTRRFRTTVRNGNLFGRGTADDKGQVHIHLKALESLQKVNGKLPST